MFENFIYYSEAELAKELITLACEANRAAYESEHPWEKSDHLRTEELLREAAERLEYLRDGWDNAVIDGA